MSTIFRYLRGFVKIRLSGDSPERFLNLCRHKNIQIWDLQSQELSYMMCLPISDFRKLKPLLRKKAGVHIRILERHGLPFFLYQNRHRKMFPVGILLCAVFLYVMSLFVWNIHIEGNHTRSTEVILDYLKEEKIVHGMPKRQIDCKEIQSLLRIRFPDIIWVSAEIRGTRLLIRVRENKDALLNPSEEAAEIPRDIIASREGLITSILIRRGTALVKAGAEVKKGDTLVSGCIEIQDDSGETISHQYTAADADIYAATVYSYQDSFLLSHEETRNTGRKHYGFSLCFQNRILSFTRKPAFSSFRRITAEYPLKLTENFYLPLRFRLEVQEEYEKYTKNYTPKEAKILAEQHLHEFLENLIQKGVQIVENNVKIEVGRNSCQASGEIRVIEEISSYAPLSAEKEALSLETDVNE